ncbi:MAG: acyl-CoA dehydratase activase [Dehalococcoidia bacterium]
MAYAGCDLGIVAAKVAIVEDGDILALETLPYRSHPKEAAVRVMESALNSAGISSDRITRCLATGFGAIAVPYADDIIENDVCLIRALKRLNPQARTILEVGAHSIMAFNTVSDGEVRESAIIDECAAGTGRFVEIMAKALEIPLEKVSEDAPRSQNPVRITSQCVVLAESDVISFKNEGYEPVDIFAGVLDAVSARIEGILRRISLDGELVMTGGLARNPGVRRNLERRLNLKLADLGGVDPQSVGALGAALLAGDKAL